MTKTEQTRLTDWRFKVLQRAAELSLVWLVPAGISAFPAKTFYKWRRRFAENGPAGLCDRPRQAAPFTPSHTG